MSSADELDVQADRLLDAVSDPATKRDLLNPFETGDWITYANELTRNYMAGEMEDDPYYLLGDQHELWLEKFDSGDRVLLCHRDGLKTTITLAYLIACLEYKDGLRGIWAMNNQGSVQKKADVEFWKMVERNPWLVNLNKTPEKETIESKKAAEEHNIAFFENDTVPRQYVIVEGGELTDKAWETLQRRLGDQKGPMESHRTLLLEVQRLASEPEMMDLDDGYSPQDVSIEIEPMTVGQSEDASFLEYQDHTEHDILQAHEVPPVIANVLKSGAFSTDTDEQRKEFADTVIGPKQDNFAGLLHETVHKALGVTDWTIDFKTRGLENRQAELDMAATKIEASQGTINEVRDLLGQEEIDRPVGDQLLLEAGGQPGGITASIQSMIEEREEEIREEQARQDRVDAMIQNAPTDGG